jgi:hypothetical protein
MVRGAVLLYSEIRDGGDLYVRQKGTAGAQRFLGEQKNASKSALDPGAQKVWLGLTF